MRAMRSAHRPLRVTLGALFAFAVAFVGTGLAGWGPAAENEQAIGEISRWCERVSGGLLREPVNTLGNLAFVIAGLVILLMLARDTVAETDSANPFHTNTPIALLYASAAVFLGPGSMVMHGSHTRFGAWLDNVSMVAYILVPWLYNLYVLGRWQRRTFFIAYSSMLLLYAAGYWFIAPDLGIGLRMFDISIPLWLISESLIKVRYSAFRWASGFLGFVIAAIFGITPADMLADPGGHWWVILFWLPAAVTAGTSAVSRRYTPWFFVGVGSFLTAYAIWLTGTADSAACNPDSVVQAHAIWHILSAVSTFAFFLFLRTERPRDPAIPTSRETMLG